MLTYPGHLHPALQQARPLAGLQQRRAKQGGDDAVGDGVELGDSSPDGGGHMLLPLLIPLGPDPP